MVQTLFPIDKSKQLPIYWFTLREKITTRSHIKMCGVLKWRHHTLMRQHCGGKENHIFSSTSSSIPNSTLQSNFENKNKQFTSLFYYIVRDLPYIYRETLRTCRSIFIVIACLGNTEGCLVHIYIYIHLDFSFFYVWISIDTHTQQHNTTYKKDCKKKAHIIIIIIICANKQKYSFLVFYNIYVCMYARVRYT